MHFRLAAAGTVVDVLLLFSIVCIMISSTLLLMKYFFGVKSIFYESPLLGHGCSLSHDRLARKRYFSLPQSCHESTNAYFFIQLDPTLRSIVHTWSSTIKDIMILLQWMMWCILFYVGFVGDPPSVNCVSMIAE